MFGRVDFMNFDGFRVLTEDDKLTVVLYVDEHQLAELDQIGLGPNHIKNQFLTEFAREFAAKSDIKQSIQKDALRFIQAKFPNLKVNTVKIMVGTMLLGTFTLAEIGNRAEVHASETLPYTTYKVQSGDSLYKIASQFNISIADIRTLNGLSTDILYVGQSIKLPFYTYTVVSGDSLSVIAKRNNTTVEQIRMANGLTSDVIYVGQKLRIPLPVSQPTTPTPEPAPENYQVYSVVSGDSLSVIAKRFNTTVDAIRSLNKLTTDVIYVGQKLSIPTTEPVPAPAPESEPVETQEPITYTVVSGDALSIIAKKFNTTVDAIKELNHLTSDIIYVGQKLQIPGQQEVTPTPELEPTPAPTEPPTTTEYQVVSGDSLSAIAKKFGTTVTAIKTANNLTSDVIYVGQRLVILAQTQAEQQPPVDTTPPAQPTLTAPSIVNATNQKSFSIQGQAEPNATVEARISDGINERKIRLTADAQGQFKTTMDLAALKDGPIQIEAIAVDQAGNAGPALTTKITKDTTSTAPALTVDEQVNLKTAAAFLVKGTAEPNAKVTISISDGQNNPIKKELQADQAGNFQSSFDLTSLSDNVLTVDAYQTDQAGNKSITSTVLVKKDTKAAMAPTIGELSILASENAKAYTISGTAEPNATIQAILKDDAGNTVTQDGKADADGNFHFQADLTDLTGQAITLSLTQADQAGNISGATTKSITVDREGPKILEISDLAIISQATAGSYEITGKTDPNSQVSINASDGTKTVLSNETADTEGNFTFKIDLSSLADGPLNITVTTKDENGNVGNSFNKTLIKDTEAPDTFTLQTSNNGIVNQYNADAFHITGTSPEDGGVVQIEITDGTETLTHTALVVDGVYDIPVDLMKMADGTLTLTATQRDVAGNTSEATTYTIKKDTVADVPVITTSQVKNNGATFGYLLQGSAEPNSKMLVTLAGQSGAEMVQQTLTADADGNFTGTFDISPFIKNKPFISVQQVDEAENKSKAMSLGVTSYIVGSGDTLWRISTFFDTSIDSIMKLNELTTSNIYVGQKLVIPSIAGIEMMVISEDQAFNMGYLYFGNSEQFLEAVQQTKGTINAVSPTYFNLNADGTLNLTTQVDRHFIAAMQANGVRVVPFLSNHWDRAVGEMALENREQLAEQIAEAVRIYNLDGVDVDIENVTDEYRDEYSDFVRLLREKLPEGKEVSTAVAANPNGWTEGWHGSYDYADLATNSDYLMIMAYDESYSGGPPGPLASVGWVEKSIQYAIAQGVPKDKIVLGIGHYGRYWKEGASYGGYGISNQQIKEAVERYNGTVTFDEASQSPKAVFTIKEGDPTINVYGNTLGPGTYTVWFENERSIRAKMDLVEKYGIKGTGNWGMEQENPEFWDAFSGWVDGEIQES